MGAPLERVPPVLDTTWLLLRPHPSSASPIAPEFPRDGGWPGERLIAGIIDHPLRCVDVSGDVRAVSVVGELDLSGRAILTRACLAGTERIVVLDLSGVTFMDCAGYHAITAARVGLQELGRTLLVVGATGRAARLIEVIGTAWHGTSSPARLEGPPARPPDAVLPGRPRTGRTYRRPGRGSTTCSRLR